jgi:hypothetical protein
MCLFFSPRTPRYMPQLWTGTSMLPMPLVRLLPMLASNQSTRTRPPRLKALICLTISFISIIKRKERVTANIKKSEIHQFTNLWICKESDVN